MNQTKKAEGDVPISVYLCRHGETEYNALGIFQGQGVDLPLNAKGKEQARELANLFGTLPVMEMGFSSPLQRARETADIVLGGLHELRRFPLMVHPLLKEGSFGWAEGRKKDEVKAQIPDVYAAWREHHNFDARLPGGESQGEIAARGMHFLDHVVELCHRGEIIAPLPERRIAVFSHASFLRCMLNKMGVALDEIPNARPLKITYRKETGWCYDGLVVGGQASSTKEFVCTSQKVR